jgi:hypothetical protein
MLSPQKAVLPTAARRRPKMYSPNRGPTERYLRTHDERNQVLKQETRSRRMVFQRRVANSMRALGSGVLARALAVAFWVTVAVLIGWVSLNALDSEPILSRLGQRGARAVDTLIWGAVALTSGLLVLYHRLMSTFVDPDRYQSASETFYALVLFFSLFFGAYSFFGWYFA